eukprot:5076904-Alexandrium_andersonii.AAC.1
MGTTPRRPGLPGPGAREDQPRRVATDHSCRDHVAHPLGSCQPGLLARHPPRPRGRASKSSRL